MCTAPTRYAVASGPQNSTGSFEIAYCHSCKLCPAVYNASFHPGPGCPNCTKPVNPPPPPPPLSTNPCIRFGHTIPVTNHVDAMIVQDSDPSISHTWTNFKFSDFSDWVNIFKPGTGTITIWENENGKRGAQLYKLSKIPLTPGPLVVVIKVAQSQAFNASGPEPFWPPRVPDNVETIAASYVQPGTGGKVRLFNLSPDTKVAGMSVTSGTPKVLAKNVQYSLGSNWFPVPVTSQTYSFSDSLTNKVLTTRVETPPPSPLVRCGAKVPGKTCAAITHARTLHSSLHAALAAGILEYCHRSTKVDRCHGFAGHSARRCTRRGCLQAVRMSQLQVAEPFRKKVQLMYKCKQFSIDI